MFTMLTQREKLTVGYIVEKCVQLFGFVPRFDDECRLVGKWDNIVKFLFMY